MIRFLVDQNFNRHIIAGLKQRVPSVDVVRAIDVALDTSTDPDVLAWAADHGCVALSHDVATLKDFAFERVARGQRMPGVFLVNQSEPIAPVIEDLVLIAECGYDGEWEGQVIYLPLR